MNKFILLFYIFTAIVPDCETNIQDYNVVKGEIKVTNCSKTIFKGDGYNKDGTEIMHSDDPLAQPNRNVIISLHPLDFDPILILTKDAFISQSQQTFIPNVLPVVVGSKVHFLNEDEFFHNVQSYTPKARFSIGRRAPGISYSVKIEKTGIVNLTCDIHAHMNAKILSFDTPFFTRLKKDGSYSIKNLPDGRYRLEVFHPFCTKIIDKVEVKGGKIFEFNYFMSNKA